MSTCSAIATRLDEDYVVVEAISPVPCAYAASCNARQNRRGRVRRTGRPLFAEVFDAPAIWAIHHGQPKCQLHHAYPVLANRNHLVAYFTDSDAVRFRLVP